MSLSLAALNYKQKSQLAEWIYLFFIGVVSPFAVGLQIFSKFSFTLSLVVVNVLGLPAIILFYRLYLPYTVGKKRYLLALLLFPVYIFINEINLRLAGIAVIHMLFIPQQYRNGLIPGHPEDFTQGYFHQSLGYTSLILLAATSLYVVKLLFKNQDHVNALENQKLTLELNHLKAQIQPHFFFNTLNNLYSLSVQNSPKTPQMITDLSGIMRYVLYQTGKEKVPLQSEVAFIKTYIRLENLRHNQPDIIDFSIQGEIQGKSIEPLLFLPLIENTFKHVLHKNIPDKWVKLVLSVDADEMIFQTSNPKLRVNEMGDNDQGGIGLKNVKQRLHLLYPGRHELVIHDAVDNFTVTLMIRYDG